MTIDAQLALASGSGRGRWLPRLASAAVALTIWGAVVPAHAKGIEVDAVNWLLWWTVACTGVAYAVGVAFAARGSRFRWPLVALEVALVVGSMKLYAASVETALLLVVLALMSAGMGAALATRAKPQALVLFGLVGWWAVPPLAALGVIAVLSAWPVVALLVVAAGLSWYGWRSKRSSTGRSGKS